MTMPGESDYNFRWGDIGDLDRGRPNLGHKMDIAVYRLMQYTIMAVLERRFGASIANGIIIEAGALAGREFCRNLLDTTLDFNSFMAELQERLREFNIGILRVEQADLDTMRFTMTVSEDLDCSGLPVTGETVCHYDEGFIAGILNVYTGKAFDVKEVDCWATGDRTCRFIVRLEGSDT